MAAASCSWKVVNMQADALAGEYAVEGKNAEGDFYEGKATIRSQGAGRT